MNIIILNDFSFINGGASNVALTSAIGLSNQGVRVTVFSAIGPVWGNLKEKGIEVICLNEFDILNDKNRLRACCNGIWNPKAAKRFSQFLSNYKANNTIVHVHSWTKGLSSSPIKIALTKGYPVILSLHDYFTACPNGGFFNYKSNKICTEQALSLKCLFTNCDCRHSYHKVWRIIRHIFQKYYSGIPAQIPFFITLSDMSEKILSSKYLPKEAKYFRLQNLINTNYIPAINVSHNSNFTVVGRVAKEKGVECFAQAISQIGALGTIIGDGPEKLTLERSFPELEWKGWLSPLEVQNALKTTRALVFPSLLYEVQPLVIHEAAALGIPVIGSSESVASEFIDNGINGLLFETGNVDSLVLAMNKILSDDEATRRMGNNNHKRFWSNPPTSENYTKQLLEIYRNVLRISQNDCFLSKREMVG